VSTFGGIIVENTEPVRAALSGVELPTEAERVLLSVRGGLAVERETTHLAEALARVAEKPVLAALGQTAADVYLLEEHTKEGLARRIVYNRDYGGWAPPEGSPRDWEADFHFALQRKDFVERLIDAEWSDLEVERALKAYDRRDVKLLPRLPPASGRQLSAFLAALGVAEPAAVVDRRGLVARWLGL
jgi:hypothetical protein